MSVFIFYTLCLTEHCEQNSLGRGRGVEMLMLTVVGYGHLLVLPFGVTNLSNIFP